MISALNAPWFHELNMADQAWSSCIWTQVSVPWEENENIDDPLETIRQILIEGNERDVMDVDDELTPYEGWTAYVWAYAKIDTHYEFSTVVRVNVARFVRDHLRVRKP